MHLEVSVPGFQFLRNKKKIRRNYLSEKKRERNPFFLQRKY